MTEPSNIPVMEISGDSVFWYFFSGNPVPMWLFDTASLHFLHVNNAAIKVYGYTEEEFLGMTIKEIRLPEDNRELEDYVRKNVGSFKNDLTWRHLKKDGSTIWVNIVSFHVLYHGKSAKMVTANDISETIKQALALSTINKELEKLSLVAKLTGNSVMILNANREIIWVNDAFTKLNGYTLAEVAGKPLSAMLHGPNSSEETTTRIKAAVSARRPFTEEIIHYSKAGRQHWILSDGQPVPQREGSPVEYIIVETDITEQKEKEAAIKSSETNMNAFFTGTAGMHILFDTSLNIITYNQLAEHFVRKHLRRNIFVGENMLNIISEATQERFLYFAYEALEGRATINREAEIPLDDEDRTVWWIINDIPAYDSFGNIMGVAFTAYDITERKRAEEHIKHQNSILKDVAWKQSHLVRAPLTNILSIANLMQTTGCDTELLCALDGESKKLDEIITGIVHKTIEVKYS